MNTTNPKKTTLSASTIYGYAAGEFGFTFFLIYLAYYLMYFLTDVLYFGTAVSAVIFTVCQWMEGISVLFCGYLIDKSGRGYRKWMLTGAIICFVFTTLMFTKFSISKSVYVYLFGLLYLFAYGGYNMMWVSYRSLLGRISNSSYDTVVLSTTGSQMGTVSAVLFSYLGIKVLSAYAGNPTVYSLSAFIYAGLLLSGILLVFTTTKSYDTMNFSRHDSTPRPRIKQMIGLLRGPIVPLMASVAFRSSTSVMTSALLVYYLRYVLQDMGFMSFYVTIVSLSAFFGAFSARKLARYVDKRHIYLGTGLINCLLLILIFFVGDRPLAFLVVMSINSYVMLLGNVLVPVFLNEVCDYNFLRTNVDVRGLTFSLGSLSLNFSQILGSGLAAFGLVYFGYQAKTSLTASTILGIRYLMSVVPASILGLGVLAFLFYKINEETMETLRKDRSSDPTQGSLLAEDA